MNRYKIIIPKILLALSLAFALPAFGQTNKNPLMTLALGDFNPSSISVVAVGEYAPDLDGDRAGVKVAGLYPVSEHVYTGFWLDYFAGDLTVGSVGVTFSAEMTVLGRKVTPYATTGVGYALSGSGKLGGSAIGTIGAGLTANLWSGKHWDLGAVVGYERTTAHSGIDIYQLGPRFTWRF